MLLKGTINVANRDVCTFWLCSAGKEISQEEGIFPAYTFFCLCWEAVSVQMLLISA
jgi:hypothetical protein